MKMVAGVYSIKTEQIQKINITIADDLVTGRNEWVDGTKNC